MKKYQIYLLLMIIFLTCVAFMHPVHKIQCEIRQHSETSMIETTLRCATKDVEDYLRKTKNKIINLEKITQQELESIFLDYFNETIQVKNKDNQRIVWSWVGTEVEYPYVWFYIEAPYVELSEQKPVLTVFCELSEEFNFITSRFLDDKLIYSDITVCNPHRDHHH